MQLICNEKVEQVFSDAELVDLVRSSYNTPGGIDEVSTVKYDEMGSKRLLTHIVQRGDYCMVKWNPSIPGAKPRGNPTIVLNDFRTGTPLAVFEASAISRKCCAATTRYLYETYVDQQRVEKTIHMIGFGPFLQAHLPFFPEFSIGKVFSTSHPISMGVRNLKGIVLIGITEWTMAPLLCDFLGENFFLVDLCRHVVCSSMHYPPKADLFLRDGPEVPFPHALIPPAPADCKARVAYKSWGRALTNLDVCVNLWEKVRNDRPCCL